MFLRIPWIVTTPCLEKYVVRKDRFPGRAFKSGRNAMRKYVIFAIALATVSQMAATRSVRADDLSVRLITGTVNANGTSQTTTNAFTIAHTANTGRYVITFNPKVFGKHIPACIVMPLGTFSVIQIFQNVSYCDFTISNFSTNAVADAVFNFMAAPITQELELSN
jgi:hypothetical protein